MCAAAKRRMLRAHKMNQCIADAPVCAWRAEVQLLISKRGAYIEKPQVCPQVVLIKLC